MLAEDGVIVHSYDVVLVILVLLLQVAQKIQLDTGLVLESLLIANYLDRYDLLQLVIEAFECLSEAA